MTERFCIRGCTVAGTHFATCPDYGKEQGECAGCAPREARDGTLICPRCYGRLRGMIRDAGDLLGRLYSLADPMKAKPTDRQRSGSSSVEPPAPVDADLLDAIHDVGATVHAWDVFTSPRTIEQALDDIANDAEDVQRMWAGWMDRNEPVDGIRSFWSVADAMAKWGPERRTKDEPEWTDDEASEETSGIPEWGDALLNRAEAERIVPARTLRRWVRDELVQPVGTIYVAGVRTVLYRRSDLLRVQNRMRERIGRPRAKGMSS